MKFAMNGALTIGTLDGANIEIRDAVGADNIFIFGLTAAEIAELVPGRNYNPNDYYRVRNPRISALSTPLASDGFCPKTFACFHRSATSCSIHPAPAHLRRLTGDPAEISREYGQPAIWMRKAIYNVARIGIFFSRPHRPRVRPRNLVRPPPVRSHPQSHASVREVTGVGFRRTLFKEPIPFATACPSTDRGE